MIDVQKQWCVKTRRTDHGTVMAVRLCTLVDACECGNPECCQKCSKTEVGVDG